MTFRCVLVGACLAILIAAGAINGIMYVLSLYFQNPAGLGLSALQAGLAVLPASVVLVIVAPLVAKWSTRFGGRQVVIAGLAFMVGGFVLLTFITASWGHGLIALDVGAASGISNMMRRVGSSG